MKSKDNTKSSLSLQVSSSVFKILCLINENSKAACLNINCILDISMNLNCIVKSTLMLLGGQEESCL